MMEDASDIAYHMPFLEECASRAGIIVEIGVGHGNGSTRAFARGLARSTKEPKMHIGVDPDPDRPQERPELFHQVVGKAEDPDTAKRVNRVMLADDADIIFIDTIHTHEQMSMELPIWSQLASEKTLWLFHDTNMFQIFNHMTVAIIDWAAANPGWEFFEESTLAHGLGLMRWKGGVWSDIQPRDPRS